MYFEQRKHKNGEIYFKAIERYIDPLTEKYKRASVIFTSDTSRGRAKAVRDLDEKIDKLIKER